MSVATGTEVRVRRRPGVGWALADAAAVTKRNLLRYVRIPTLLVFSTIQPVMFVLLFRYVFGGAINIPGINYVDFLMPGIFVQTAAFGSTQTGIGLAEDLNKGLIDRFRSLPMSRSAVLAGRTSSDGVRNLFVVLLMLAVGYLVGFRFHEGLGPSVAAIALAVLFGFCFSWISAWIGLGVRDVESAQAAGFIWIFPFTFASSAFVEPSSMPGWLAAFANHQPITATVNAMRDLALGSDVTGGSTVRDLFTALAWMGGILLVFVPLAVRNYRRIS